MTDSVFQKLRGGGGGGILPWKRTDKIEHEGMGTCAGTEISQDADKAHQKVKWFLKVHKTYKLLREAFVELSFPPSF